MDPSQNLEKELRQQLEELQIKKKEEIQFKLGREDIKTREWTASVLFKVHTTKVVNSNFLKEAMLRSWSRYEPTEISNQGDGWFTVGFKEAAGREAMLQNAPWHYKSEALIMTRISGPPTEIDRKRCCLTTWVQLHNIPVGVLTTKAVEKVAGTLGRTYTLEKGADAVWDRFARIRIDVDPLLPLKDYIDITLPSGERRRLLVTYEKIHHVCLYCACIGHEVGDCEKRRALLEKARQLTIEAQEELSELVELRVGGWVNKDYKISEGMASLKTLVREEHTQQIAMSGEKELMGQKETYGEKGTQTVNSSKDDINVEMQEGAEVGKTVMVELAENQEGRDEDKRSRRTWTRRAREGDQLKGEIAVCLGKRINDFGEPEGGKKNKAVGPQTLPLYQ